MKAQKGITLIALIITIIVMLILVGVSVNIALGNGLFKSAQSAAQETEEEKQKETDLSSGKVTIGGVTYNLLDEYISGQPALPENWIEVEMPTGWNANAVRAVKEIDPETGEEKENTIIPLPNGFAISDVDGEKTYDGGLVIKDIKNGNEFVWIPVSGTYTEGTIEAITATLTKGTFSAPYDSYKVMNFRYGVSSELGKINSDTAFNNVFTFSQDKTNIENSANLYKGFYVGRYETTYDRREGKSVWGNENEIDYVARGIGVRPGKYVLNSENLFEMPVGEDYLSYRWWGLYKVQKDMYANNSCVGSLMISNEQWDLTISYTGATGKERAQDTYPDIEETNKADVSGYAGDKYKNVYDLAGNVSEWTLNNYDKEYPDNQPDLGPKSRVVRGGCRTMGTAYMTGAQSHNPFNPDSHGYWLGSRVALYIK